MALDEAIHKQYNKYVFTCMFIIFEMVLILTYYLSNYAIHQQRLTDYLLRTYS